MNKDDFIENDEELYRRYSYDSETKAKINSKAFFDRDRQPSVDRAKLRDFQPALSKWCDTDGVVSLIAGDIRGILIENHTVDVIYAPILEDPKNLAHSLITIKPKGNVSKSKQKEAFSTLRRSLVLHSTVEIEPQEN